ncbi:MAG: hypothetical protein ABJO36_01285 [Litorimonas sp.]
MRLSYLSGILTAATIGLLILFWNADPGEPLGSEERLKQDYRYRLLNSAELRDLGDEYASAYENSEDADYPVEMFGWLSYPLEGPTALFMDEAAIGRVGSANCISGVFIAPLGENREKRVEAFNGKFVRLIGHWHDAGGYGIYPALSEPDNLCENKVTFIAADMFRDRQTK